LRVVASQCSHSRGVCAPVLDGHEHHLADRAASVLGSVEPLGGAVGTFARAHSIWVTLRWFGAGTML
jgi:hypothetical protein